MSDQEAMAAMAAQQGTNAMGPATFSLANQPQLANNAPPPTGMSMPVNPQGWSGAQGVAGNHASWYDNLFKAPSKDAMKAWQQLGALGGQAMQRASQPHGILAQQPTMGGGGYRPQQPQSTMPALALIHPSTRIY